MRSLSAAALVAADDSGRLVWLRHDAGACEADRSQGGRRHDVRDRRRHGAIRPGSSSSGANARSSIRALRSRITTTSTTTPAPVCWAWSRGMGTANSATATMELGMDPRFDLSHAYWLVAGIAGVDPADASIGSAAWAEYLVDGDLAHDDRSAGNADGLAHGLFRARHTQAIRPQETHARRRSVPPEWRAHDWAFKLTREVKLDDSPELKKCEIFSIY